MELNLKGLHAVITGGSSGIGAAIVHALAAEGCRVSFCARDSAKINAFVISVAHFPGEVNGHVVNVTDNAGFTKWLDSLGPFDIFIPNVSAISADWRDSLRTDITATVDTTEAALPYLLRSKHGAITYIGSKAGSLGAPNSNSYGAAKAAMAHYMKSLSMRLLPHVRVNTVSPGDTFFVDGYWDQIQRDEPEVFVQVLQRNPLKRLATAEEIARVVAFVSSPAASFVAGANWYVDGGSATHVQF